MNQVKHKSIPLSLILAASVAVFVIVTWTLGSELFVTLKNLVYPVEAVFFWWKGIILLAVALILGYLSEQISLKKLLPAAAAFILLWFAASVAAKMYWNASLLFIPLAMTIVLTLLIVHLKKLWMIDADLTDKLIELASTNYLAEGTSAEVRIESGLRLLETILPLAEAIVFRYDKEQILLPAGRTRGDKPQTSAAERQNNWRENMQMCVEAFETRQTIIKTGEKNETSANVALPLICDDLAVGVLFVRIPRDFEPEDRFLLEAFGSQLAGNIQRRELQTYKLPHQSWWNFLSTVSAENRVYTTNLIHRIIKEQSFGTVASLYLNEAHAIAYLDGTLAYLNRKMRHLADFDTRNINEKDIFSLLECFQTEIFNDPRLALRRVLQTGDSFRCELELPDKTLDMQITLIKVPDETASIHETNVPMKPACFLLTFRNITAQKENERLRSDMASLMSHELRTPITSIQGFAEILQMDDAISDESREFLDIITKESQRLSKMLTTFLSVSNLEQSDKMEFIKTPVKVDTVVNEVVGEFSETAKRKRIRLMTQHSKTIPPVAADKGLIRRAITHLLDNAIRYSPEKSSVIISTILEADFLRIVIEDRGYGIAKEEQEKIWQKFYRVARDGQDKEEESTGLGLSLVKEIVEQHGGAVEIESEVGLGSKFSFRLPRL